MNTSLEERKAMGELALRSLFKNMMTLIPIAGPILSDVLFEFRNKIKQERLCKFVDLLKEHFSKQNPQINIDNATSEEFSDLFESVLNKVSKTKSERKMVGFKNLLLHGLKSKEEIDDCELFSELLTTLNENDILILHKHKDYLYGNKGLLVKKRELKEELENYQRNQKLFQATGPVSSSFFAVGFYRNEEMIKEDIIKIEEQIDQYEEQVTPAAFSITKGEFTYRIQNLYNKGLLIDEGVGSIGTSAFELMAITDFGIRFLEFITFS